MPMSLHYPSRSSHSGVCSIVASLFFVALLFSTASGAGPLHDAAETGNLAQIQRLIADGADIAAADSRGIWPLLAAVTTGNTAAVELLLRLKADPNQTDRYQYSALHEAASLGYYDVVKTLISANARINLRDVSGITPLGYALRSSSPETAALLQDMGGIQ